MTQPQEAGRRIRIAVLTSFDPMDKRKLSGITYHMVMILQKYVGDVVLMGPVKRRKVLRGIYNRIARFFPKPYNLDHSLYLAFRYMLIFNRKLSRLQADVVFAPRGSTEIALVRSKLPIVYLSDTTFKSLYGYYEWFRDFMDISVWEGNLIERMVLRKSAAVVMASQWAARSAIEDYGISPEKVFVVPFGPNMEFDQIPESEVVMEAIRAKDRNVCRLLFLGVEWYRKGGYIAFDALKAMIGMGVDAEMTVVGCVPPEGFEHPKMRVIPYLDKNDEVQYQQFISLFYDHHFLILPTRAECYGVVFAEASAFGLPSLSTQTGGVSTVVQEGRNGYCLPLDSPGVAFAALAARIFKNYETEYLPLSFSSRQFFDEELSPEVFGKRMAEVFRFAMNRGSKS